MTRPGPPPPAPLPAADLPELVRRARVLVAARGGSRTILGIAGAPGSGKSTLAAALAEALAPDATVVPMDGFHLAERELARLGRRGRKGAPDTFDAAGYAALLTRLRSDRDDIVYSPAFDRHLEEPIAGSIPVPPDRPLVITEGNYLLLEQGAWARVRGQLDAVWFIEADHDRRVERLVARHARHGKSAEAARAWVLDSDERNAVLVQRTKFRSDLVVSVA
ncbi:nucleoside/nucleotide kinase family protein [Nocardioides pantholopis]|uniref:nucleoside/nucleotide kinase family protein n=1 Tax=Nocardioides pantholopis TaxID=2483798 RepID=UPI001F493C1E|nr:nucleoside/nucleotide kinase family protein [Nocardioides pantholopis]